MPSNKQSGRIEKVRKHRLGGNHLKNHRWESFSTKIARLNSLQHLRKVRRHDLDTEDLSTSTSYFQNGLQKWSELNLSKPFCSFKSAVLPLSESLPQILHYEERIMQLLAQYISLHDKDALEPLLDLLTALAHDLGVRFEKHFPRSLGLLLAIVQKPQEVEVIEWTFGAMAFLFKYLSKLLVPDLKPTFDVLTPLLGKSRQPPHIARFAAEAMSFLVRKAAAPSHREAALVSFVEHVRNDLPSAAETRQFTLYKDGLMTMFAEAVKGTDMTIHSAGGAIISALIDAIPEEEYTLNRDSHWLDLVCGVLTSTIHYVTADTIESLAEEVFDKIRSKREIFAHGSVQWQTAPLIKILSVLAGVRKGTRVRNWDPLIRELVSLLSITGKSAEDIRQDQHDIVWNSIISRVAIVWYHAPIDVLIPHITPLLQSLTREPLLKWYIPFCAYFCDLDQNRFGILFRNSFQKFVATHWSEGQNQDVLLPQAWQDQIVSKFERLEISPFPERGPYNKDPQLLEMTAVHPSTNARIAELLLRKLKLALRPSSSLASDEVHFIVSHGFQAYLRMGKAGGLLDTSLSPLLRAAVRRFARSVGFLQAYLEYERLRLEGRHETEKQDSPVSDESAPGEDSATESLFENLSSPSHHIRLASLELLKQLGDTQGLSECVGIMIELEQIPLRLDNTRTIAMLLRKLGQQYSSIDSSGPRIAIPRFIFGMLTVKLSPVWDSAVEVLQHITQTKLGEDAVAAIALEWLENPSARWTPSAHAGDTTRPPVYTNFECTALGYLERSADAILNIVEKADDMMLRSFDEKQQLAEPILANARSRALKVLNAMPTIAEKRSRRLVPHLLSWLTDEDEAPSAPDEEAPQDQRSDWSLADRKAILGVFSRFVNPRVVYQQDSVYRALLKLMENGDVEIQKLALKAILAWKQEGVKTYQENLEYLLDDARFKDEIAVFLQGDSVIKPEHRSELMPVLLRLLYGRTISKKGAASGRNGLQATRLAVLRNLSVDDMGSFLDIAAGKLKEVRVTVAPTQRKKFFEEAILSVRKQMGFLNMISSFISELGSSVEPYVETLLNAVLYCLVYSSRRLNESLSDQETGSEEDDKNRNNSLLKATRSLGIKCLTALFQNAQNFQWDPYHDVIVEEVIAPRLDNLPTETTQGVSGMLQLVSTLSVLPRSALLLAPHQKCLPQGVLPKVVACLGVEKTKDEVKIFVLVLLQNLVRLALAPASESEFNEVIMAELLDPNARAILANIMTVLRTPTISNSLLEASVETILALAPVLQDLDNAQAVIRISSFLLKQPPRRVNPKIKGRILLIVEQFVAVSDAAKDLVLLSEVYDTLSSLFSYFKDRQNRHSLCQAMKAISQQDADVAEIASLCLELNTFKEGRVDEPDYDRRLASFNAISTDRDLPWTPKQWLPLLHNLIFFIRMDEEFGILSSNSADGIRRFIKTTADCQSESSKQAFEAYMKDILMPSIYSGARESSGTVRREYLRVFGFLLTVMPDWAPVADLSGLMSERQEDTLEPTFFFDILSPATSRQLEALRTLEAANSAKEMSSQNLTQFFIPLLEHFIFGRVDGSDDHGLGAQATSTIANLAMSLQWSHWRSTFHRYSSYIVSRPEMQKHTIRLLGRFSDALVDSLDRQQPENMDMDQPDVDQPDVDQPDEDQPDEVFSPVLRRLRQTAPKTPQLAIDVLDYFLPPLVKHLHEKDESEVSYRVPVGVVIVKLLKLLPSEQMDQKLAGVLTDICHILRSKAWESREMARDTLVKIAVVLGPSFFGFILKELRGALTRGYQLHVLSYTMHSILVAVVPTLAPGDLDHCLPGIVTVVMDDIFGVIGQEKDADGYISQMKEIKSSKSQDSMELVAKNASISRLVALVRPLQSLLMQKVDLKMVRKIDSLMGRIGSGLLQNPAAESRDTLVFCYEVIQETYRSQRPEAEQKLDPRLRKYLVQKGAKKSGERGKTTKHTYKLVRFALDILRSMFKKHDSLRTPSSVAGFLPILGDAIVGTEEEVKISAFRLLATIVKVPFTTDDGKNIYKVAVKEATKSISMATSSTTDLSQAALKMLAVVLRERQDIPIKDAAIDMLLGKLKEDFTEPLYRHVTFNFLRSVLDRRIETAVVYDTVDHVGTVMISNDDKDTRDLARGAFFQFIREYPQKKARWGKQLDFVVANLKYDREGGRLSVMEIIHLLLMKSADDFVQEIAGTCFLPLFLVLANDDSDKCRLAAAELLKKIFHKSDKERTQKFLTLLRSWLEKDNNPMVQRLALQVFGFYFESNEGSIKNTKDFRLVLAKCMGILGSKVIVDADEQLVETTLGIVRHLTMVSGDQTLSANREELWADVAGCLRHPAPLVKLTASRLINTYLVDFAKQRRSSSRGETIEGSHGLVLTVDDTFKLTRLALGTLNGHEVDETLATELVQMLVFLGSCLPATEVTVDELEPEEGSEDKEEAEVDDYDRKNLEYLFWRLSGIIRKEIPPRSAAINSKVAAMEILETVCRRASILQIEPSLKTILTPLQHLTDPSISAPFSNDEGFKTKLEDVKTRAQILMDSLQKKFGTTAYSKTLLEIREEVRARRMQRTSKRKIEAVAHPEKYGQDKRKRFEKNKERRKVRSREHKSMRQSYNSW
ncbi:down-regulated in metastasis domain-containing protein [Hirsutella rhossiliensis]|uniref:Down-regulated in metastasis domain-containing protein n=1 Tax=Hirsutella rhossiliensis TaxID=111463 RepID=A0A9P8MTI4_9HYPO|nr:down-regulated in metastasis domain-containing protein [Hirsutella rhossiliensis]KAH0960894.1 down-regulated in metastasis domain-containing protein [Hirsutella rhossiliensis]